ncbi:uncharacterized protein LOC127108069 [Lathyrus oleraceus]|uniref:uncharacterized protein LOC127108069 n=1 Tax=Pisum sativum TaxID=3888 RepID=UPI0021D2220C|nr:uncharacterized protein LOC127108069 [Pisum sativum]
MHSNRKGITLRRLINKSIGGLGFGYDFDPINKDDWIKKAKSSIEQLILDYENGVTSDENIIDGIDINYEHISSSVDDFSNWIGEIIKQLKEDPNLTEPPIRGPSTILLLVQQTQEPQTLIPWLRESMNVVSIAPTERLRSHYLKLYRDNQDNIDWIDYKFYNQFFKSTDDFVDLFYQLVSDYGTPYKLLAGVNTEMSIPPTTRNQDLFVGGCSILINRASLAGVFVWDANASTPTYSLEVDLQKLLTKSDY